MTEGHAQELVRRWWPAIPGLIGGVLIGRNCAYPVTIGGLLLAELIGWNLWGGVAFIAVVAGFYVILGGMRTVLALDVWQAVFKSMGARYEAPRLVLFRNYTQSACGHAVAAVGPFYCPADREVYLDTAFFNDLSRKFGAPGDFAQAYVVAHEVGHHVQNLMGVMQQYDAQAQRSDARTRNALSVRLELQADCFAGVWGHFAAKRNLLDPGDIEEGLRAAAAVGDDRIQEQAKGRVVPESFTHGSADQRMRWFRVGLDSGDVRKCNTFASRGP